MGQTRRKRVAPSSGAMARSGERTRPLATSPKSAAWTWLAVWCGKWPRMSSNATKRDNSTTIDCTFAGTISPGALPDVQVVVLTSTVELDIIQQALDAGAKAYMLKNVTIDTMAQTIRSAFG